MRLNLTCTLYSLTKLYRDMEVVELKPKKMERATSWSEVVEEAYRFQLAGYRDEQEYLSVNRVESVDRWPHNNYVKKLRRKDGCFYYYDRTRECPEKDLMKVKLYIY